MVKLSYTIDEFLDDEEMEKNPSESGINYNLYAWDNPYYFMTFLTKNDPRFSHVCIPSHSLMIDRGGRMSYSLKTLIVLNVWSASWPFNVIDCVFDVNLMKKTISNCRKKNIRFIWIMLNLALSPGFGHANSIIIDLNKREIERHEPYGELGMQTIDPGIFYSSKVNLDEVADTFMDFFTEKVGLGDFTYVSPRKLLRETDIHIQKNRMPAWASKAYVGKMDAYSGLCVTIQTMYSILRLLNPNVDRIDVYKHIVQKENKILLNQMLRLAKFIQKFLIKNQKKVKELSQKIDEASEDLMYFTGEKSQFHVIPYKTEYDYNVKRNLSNLKAVFFGSSDARMDDQYYSKRKSKSQSRKK